MQTKWKKAMSLTAAAVLFSMTATVTQPKPAHAIISIMEPNPMLFWTAVASISVGGAFAETDCWLENCYGFSPPIISTVMVLVGVLFLDEGSGPGLKYSTLSREGAATIGTISEEERSAYNDSLDEINAVAESVEADLAKQKKPDAKFVRSRWLAYTSDIDPAAVSAAEKVSAHLITKLRK